MPILTGKEVTKKEKITYQFLPINYEQIIKSKT